MNINVNMNKDTRTPEKTRVITELYEKARPSANAQQGGRKMT